MRIHSDTLTRDDIYSAASTARVSIIGFGEFGSRKRQHSFEVYLSGSSPYASQHDYSHKGATWDEWGNFLAILYKQDAKLVASYYKSLAHFLEETRACRDHPGNADRKYRAAWLSDSKLASLA